MIADIPVPIARAMKAPLVLTSIARGFRTTRESPQWLCCRKYLLCSFRKMPDSFSAIILQKRSLKISRLWCLRLLFAETFSDNKPFVEHVQIRKVFLCEKACGKRVNHIIRYCDIAYLVCSQHLIQKRSSFNENIWLVSNSVKDQERFQIWEFHEISFVHTDLVLPQVSVQFCLWVLQGNKTTLRGLRGCSAGVCFCQNTKQDFCKLSHLK